MKKYTLSKSGAMRVFLFQEETSHHLLHTLETGCCMSPAFLCTELSSRLDYSCFLPFLHPNLISMGRSSVLFLTARPAGSWLESCPHLPVSPSDCEVGLCHTISAVIMKGAIRTDTCTSDLSHSSTFPLNIRCPASKFSPR